MNPSPPSSALVSLLALRRQAAWFRAPAVRLGFLAFSIALVVGQQIHFASRDSEPDATYRNVLNLGVNYGVYFPVFRHFGAFPVSLQGMPGVTLEQVAASLDQLGSRLTPSLFVYNRASVFLFYPDAMTIGTGNVEMRTAHAIWFTTGLVSIVVAFSFLDLPLVGLLLALLCGSNPFQLYEVYRVSQSNVFATVISTGLMITAISLAVSSRHLERHRLWSFALVAVSAVICGLQYEIRLEGVGVFVGELVALALLCRHSRLRRLGYVAVFALTLAATNTGLDNYFAGKFTQANALVERSGGTPVKPVSAYYGTPWWALWSGLGDFDETSGFLADDRAALSYYYGHDTSLTEEQSFRQRYINAAAQDPLWWTGIVLQRLRRVLVENTPFRLELGAWHWKVPLSPMLVMLAAVPLFLVAMAVLGRSAVTFVLVPLSIGLVSLGQLADYGLQFYSVVHLVALAYVGGFFLEVATWQLRRLRGSVATGSD